MGQLAVSEQRIEDVPRAAVETDQDHPGQAFRQSRGDEPDEPDAHSPRREFLEAPIEGLDDVYQATWDDLMYQVYVRQKIAMGIQAGEDGRVQSHDEVKRKFLGI